MSQFHKVPFYVCAPVTSIDTSILAEDQIPIEERNAHELAQVTGAEISTTGEVASPVKLTTVHLAAPGIGVWNPAFDVTPATLIEGIVTERGVITKGRGEETFKVTQYLKKTAA